jgi:hypothetical protein
MLPEFIKKWFAVTGYQSDIENYILARNPQDICDIERLMMEYNYKLSYKGDCRGKN